MENGEMEFERTGSQFAPMVKLVTDGQSVEGKFLSVTTGTKKKTGKTFPLLNLKVNGTGTEVGVPMAGHLVHLVKEAALKSGDYIRITALGWDLMEDGTKCRKFLLEKAKAA